MKAQGIANPVRKRLYSIKEAAEYLSRTIWGVRELQWKGILPFVRFDRRVFFDIHDLDEVIERHKERFND
jgi:hypothetical protein